MATALGQGLQSAQLTNGTPFSRRYQVTRTLRFGITEGEQRQLGFYPSQLKLGCAAQALAPTAVIYQPRAARTGSLAPRHRAAS
jgi:hypothetical protein